MPGRFSTNTSLNLLNLFSFQITVSFEDSYGRQLAHLGCWSWELALFPSCSHHPISSQHCTEIKLQRFDYQLQESKGEGKWGSKGWILQRPASLCGVLLTRAA